ncbi:MAG TPA: endolytic transglycosylase MltG [Candidatus Pacebacteria bacterium]|nr:endolytic transglycosylase MltG [Candidatus Paceibacterota bacterium]
MKAFAIKVWQIWVILITSGLIALTVVAGGLWWVLQPAQVTQTGTQAFIVPKGQSVKLIGQRLEQAGLIKHQLVFSLVVRWLGLTTKIQAGTFQLSPSWSVSKISQELTQGTNDLWITLPEGWRREEMAEYLSKQELTEFNQADFLALTLKKEGQLFPDTYLVPRQITAEGLVAILTLTFDKKITQGLSSELAQSQLTPNQILVLASLIEREAAEVDQMRQVSGVMHNRLDLGMPLQIDATLQYAKGYSANEKTWWGTPLAADKTFKSAFNTYLNPGLPPAPIANPGLSAIMSALKPTESDYLYYLHDSQGKLHLAKTLAEHTANIQKYLK